MNCPVCKNGQMFPDVSSYFAKIGERYVIIENVPCYKCEQCGEILYSALVMEKIDEILESVKPIVSKIFIMDYEQAA